VRGDPWWNRNVGVTLEGAKGCYLSLAKTAFGSAMLHSSTMSMCRSSAAVQMRALNVSAENDPVLADDSELTEERSQAMRQRASACKKVTLINLHVDGLPSKRNTCKLLVYMQTGC